MAVPKLTLPSALGHDFAKVQSPSNPRSSFDRSFTRKTSIAAAKLIPIYVDEVLPGDTINMRAKFVARIQTLLYPIMDNVHLDTFWFYAPNRILWDNWKRFNGERTTPTQSIDLLIPALSGDPLSIDPFSLGDYMGLPTTTIGDDYLSAMFFRMYNRVYNDWFRDENLQNSITEHTDDGPDPIGDYPIRVRGKRHDYFSSCLPWPQKGDAVSLPLGSYAPVVGTGQSMGFTNGGNNLYATYDDRSGFNGQMSLITVGGAAGSYPGTPVFSTGDNRVGLSTVASETGVIADFTGAIAATVNDMREAVAIQQLLELDARGGTRYIEQMEHMWGVKVPDYRLQRPEYLGGSTQRMDIHSVPQTAPGTTPQATLSAFGQMETDSGFTFSAVEHGILMCIVNVRADVTYQQGIHKMWNRRTRYDFYQPPLAHLGEQAVLMRELYYTGVPAADDVVFGYQERWAEYRYAQNLVSGAMRSDYATTLDAWHLALEFTTPPVLENGFIEDAPPIERITAISDVDSQDSSIIIDMFGSSRWARIMPVYSTPGLERL